MAVQADIPETIEGIGHGFQQAGQALSEQISHCRQVYGAGIVDACSLLEPGRYTADGVFSEGPLVVVVVTADYLPILMSSRGGRVVVALHGGWQRLVVGIVGAAVTRFNARGVASADIQVAISPEIKACCYGVSARFIETLQVDHGRPWEGTAPPWSQHRPLPERPPRFTPPESRQVEQDVWLNLVAFCRQLFQAVGAGLAQIEASVVCACYSGDAFVSHRRCWRLGEEKCQQYVWTACKP